MKLLVYILSVSILILTSVPCIDEAPNNHLTKVENTTHNASDNHQDHSDHCSPFCTCQCCGSPVVVLDNVAHFTSFSVSQKHFIGYTSTYISSLCTAIWQPPKVS